MLNRLCPIRFLVSCAAFVGVALTSCSEHETKLEITAKGFSKGAEECLLDVRDRKYKYETSPNCNALGTLITQFIEAEGMDTKKSDRIALILEKGLATAWMARAVSLAGNRPLSLW